MSWPKLPSFDSNAIDAAAQAGLDVGQAVASGAFASYARGADFGAGSIGGSAQLTSRGSSNGVAIDGERFRGGGIGLGQDASFGALWQGSLDLVGSAASGVAGVVGGALGEGLGRGTRAAVQAVGIPPVVILAAAGLGLLLLTK